MTTPVSDASRKAIARNLREFGYAVTDEFVSQEIDRLLAGEKPTNAIGMFTESQMKKNGLL